MEENAVDEELKKLHTSVRRLKSSRKVGVKYMNMQEVMQYQIRKAIDEDRKFISVQEKCGEHGKGAVVIHGPLPAHPAET